MVYPVNNIEFKIGTKGMASAAGDMCIVKDMETFSINFDNGIEQWNPIDQDGWVRRLMTSKSLGISLSGKRNYGDPGNDYVASLAYENGNAACSILETVFPDGSKLTMDCIITVSASDGGSATDVAQLDFECLSDGKPRYIKSRKAGV